MDQQNNPSVPGSEPENGHPRPVIRPLDDSAQPGAGQPAAGWGAPQPPMNQQPGQPAAGWGAPQPPVNQQPAAGWGAPQQYDSGQPRASFFKNWSLKKGLIVGGVAVVVAAAAGAGAYAAGNGTAAADTTNAQGPGAGQNGQGGFGGPGGTNAGPGGLGVGMGGLNAAVHSEYVVLQNGSYVTMAGQLGTVTDISASSMTVKSEDGFTRSYALGTDVVVAEGVRQRGSGTTGTTLTLADVKSGSSVRVTALKESDKYTAQSIQIVTATTSSTQGTGTTN
ncbi:hypothetical protein [Arthrobacter sp. FW306-2-2C-D06B]|uniref:hypothetical protein n=1 Tax=Arthrobacter sp. FW306-2-2C-D06B TaxID=2879618 RepID=UPI001F3DC753|nr:hypothetical protein [Arthrobacter sp. FW306-2-2C-D06B]UKA60969.1 hypothetical protein LFT47_03020 [Arthrobacter sp. FW306-2-2C-D06B]